MAVFRLLLPLLRIIPFGQAFRVGPILTTDSGGFLYLKIRCADRGMSVMTAMSVTLTFVIALTAVIAANYRINVGAHWEEMRCSPYVIPIAGFYKPTLDPRSAMEFARANFSFCQKEFVQAALRDASQGVKSVVAEQGAITALVQDAVSVFADIFIDLWSFCSGAYATFKERMGVVSQLFQNMMMNMHSLIDRMQGAILNLMMAMISMVVAFVNSVQVFLVVAIIIVGILIIMQILLFFLLLPISGLILTMSAIASVAVVTAVTIVAGVEASGGCFTGDTRISIQENKSKPIQDLRIGEILRDGGKITAVHRFRTQDALFRVGSSIVSGEHLVIQPNTVKIPVKDYPGSVAHKSCSSTNELWCLTTTTRTIPTPDGTLYADWEEIDADDTDRLKEWAAAIWHRLNGVPTPLPIPESFLQSEAGLSPTCTVRRLSLFCGIPYNIETIMIDHVRIGDVIDDGPGWTQVIGRVDIAGEEVLESVILDHQQMSVSTWILEDVWKPAGFSRQVTDRLQPTRWIHLYTSSGTFSLTSGLQIRDASDVGLPALSSLVESIVL